MNTATAADIPMPRLSDSMEEGTIIAWLAQQGALIAEGDDLLEVETDKATMTVQAEFSGILEILVAEGSTVAVGETIARVVPAGDAPHPQPRKEPPARSAPSTDHESPAPVARPTHAGPLDAAAGNGSPRATPLARRAAATHGIPIATIGKGSGAGGRITKRDVLAAAGIPAEIPIPAETHAVAAPIPDPQLKSRQTVQAVDGAKGASTIIQPSRLQAAVSRRMAESKATIPHFQVETEVRMDRAIELRKQLKRIAADEPVPSFTDLIIRAAALALRAHPKANGSYRDGNFELHERINVGIAVAARDALVVPTIFDADQKSLGAIGRESRSLAEKVRSGQITPPELAGGTFTISNLGMFGMTAITPVVNPPQAAILGVGETRPVLTRGVDGEIEDAALMTLTLSCDHRILYGAEAAEFLSTIRELLDSPLRVAL